MAMLEHPRLTGALRSSYLLHDTFDLAHHQACRAQALAKARLRRSKGGGSGFSWTAFAGGAASGSDAETKTAREQHKRLISVVSGMVGGDVSSQELHGAAQLVYELLGSEERSVLERRAALVAAIGFVEQDLFKEALQLVPALRAWRDARTGLEEPAARGALLSAGASEFVPGGVKDVEITPGNRAHGSGEVLVWEEGAGSLPLYASDEEEDDDEDYDDGVEAAQAGAGGDAFGVGAGAAEGEGTAEWLEALILEHCAMVGLPGEEMIGSLYSVLLSRQSDDDVQARLFDLLGLEALELISALLKHRAVVPTPAERQLRAREASGAHVGPMVSQMGAFSVMTASDKALIKALRREGKKARRQADLGAEAAAGGMEQESWLKQKGFDPAAMREKRLKELQEGPKWTDRQTTFDGSVSGFGGVNTGGPKLNLPPGTQRIVHKKEGYEEILVPPATPAPKKHTERLIPVEEFSSFCQPAFAGMTSLNRVQSMVFDCAYKTGNNMLVCAPTGAGKTECAMMTVLQTLEEHLDHGVLRSEDFKIVYVAPMKALAAEVTAKFSTRLQGLGLVVKELTGDMQLTRQEITDTHMLVVTPEKWDVMTRKSSDAALTSLVKLLIIDEIHLLNEDRGAVLEAIVARTLRQVETSQSMIRIVGLSATLPTYKDVALFLRVQDKDLFYFDNSYRPVPLETSFIGVMGNNMNKQKAAMLEVTYRKVLERVQQGHQVMVFVHSRKDTYKTAKTLIEMAQQENTTSVFDCREDPKHTMWQKTVDKSRNPQIRELFSSGFACHHAGILRSDRNLVEKVFGLGLVKVLVCTATLAWGVNLPAHSVVIKGTQIYDAKAGKFVELGVLDVMQIFGRAGRPQFDKSGEGIIITTHDKLNHYLQLMHNALPIESQLSSSLTDHLNAEVVLGTVRNTQEAVAWLSYTYMYIRMLKNPAHYGVPYHEIQADPRLTARCRELIEGSIKELAKAKMLRFNFETSNMNTTDTGIVASHFYIKYASLELYNEMVHAAMSEADCFDVLSRSSEFENVQARDEENPEMLKLLANACPVKVKTNFVEGEGIVVDQYSKVNILLQAYISRVEIDGFALVSDTHHVSQSAGRIFRALFELALKKGWVTLASKLLTLCKVVDRRIWHTQHPLRQFERAIPNDWYYRLEEKNLDLDKLVDMQPNEVSLMLRQNGSGNVLMKFVRQFPYLEIDASVQPITRTILRVTLKVMPQFEWNDRASGSVEPFWVWVEDNENERIYHTEYLLIHKKQKDEVHTLAFTVPIFEPLQAQYVVRAVSDRWLGADYSQIISLAGMVLPEKYPPHTQLLKLCPLPKSALQQEKFESLYKFTHFNAIQTQVFHSMYHTDLNILLGAPTGSGKTNCCELAMLRLFRTRPTAKVVYVAPMKALVRERIKDWRVRLVEKLGKRVVELTGDTSDMSNVDRADVIITTPEKWDGVSRAWASRKYVQHVGLVIIDEIHLLGEDRGPVLEIIVSRMRYISQQTSSPIRFVGMSTAIANAKDVADWLGAEEGGVFNFHPSVRPVPMQVHIQGFDGKHYCPRMATMNKPCFAAIQDYSPDQPVIVFVSSRRQTRLTALDLIQLAAQSDQPRRWVRMPDYEMEDCVQRVRDANLRHTLSFGVGLHHAGLAESDRSLCETLFEAGKIQVLVSTSTLAWGVNLPAHLVIIKGTEFYDAPAKRYVDFPITDVLQMMGRAGRPQFDTVGIAVVMVHAPKKAFYKRFLYEPFPVESALADCLHNHVNAEVAAGTIRCERDAVDYLTWTFFFRRLLGNPTYYHLEDTSQEGVASFLSDLVVETLRELHDAGCIEMAADGAEAVETTTLGRIASHYYLDYTSVKLFAERVSAVRTEEGALTLLCDATEFAELPVRHNEEHHNADLAKEVRYGHAGAMESPHTKASLLVQAHVDRAPFPIADYLTDLRSLFEQTGRTLQALIDVAADAGYLHATRHAMRLSATMAQALWADASPFLQLPHCTAVVAERLQQSAGGRGLAGLLGAARDRAALSRALAPLGSQAHVEAAVRVAEQLPLVSIAAQVRGKGGKSGAEQRPGEEATVTLTATVLNPQRRGIRAYAPKVARARDEGWWALVGCPADDEVLAVKRVTLRRETTTFALEVLLPERSGEVALSVELLSDCYLGLDARAELPLTLFAGK